MHAVSQWSRSSHCYAGVGVCVAIPLMVACVSDARRRSCQTYEGGFAGVPWSEAHGGYTFCAVASLALLGSLHRANLPALMVSAVTCVGVTAVVAVVCALCLVFVANVEAPWLDVGQLSRAGTTRVDLTP